MASAAPAPSKLLDTGGRTTLVDQSARAVKWSLLYNIAPRFVTPFSTMVLAMLLTPDDFGLVAISTFVIALARVVVELGLGKTVIQRQTEVQEAASVGLWMSLLAAVLLYLLLSATAPAIARAYNDGRVADVIRVAALALPLTALATIPKALMRRNLEFRKLFWVNSSFLIVQALASVGLAIAGIGYWSLILGQLIGMATSAGLAWLSAHWRPTFGFHRALARSMLGFSVWVMISGLQNWLFLYADNAIAGLYLGVRLLGVYSLGFSIALLIPGFLEASLNDVAYPAFCKIQDTPPEVGRSLLKLQTLLAAVLFPVAIGMSALAPAAINSLYGEKWQGLGNVIAVLVIMPGLNCIWALNENAYQAVGRADVWPKLAAFSLLGLLVLLWIAAPYGLMVFTLARFLGAWILPLGNVFLGTRTVALGVREQLRGFVSPFVCSVIMYLMVWLLIRQAGPILGLNGWVKLLSIAVAGAGTYLSLVRLTNRDLWMWLRASVRQVFS